MADTQHFAVYIVVKSALLPIKSGRQLSARMKGARVNVKLNLVRHKHETRDALLC